MTHMRDRQSVHAACAVLLPLALGCCPALAQRSAAGNFHPLNIAVGGSGASATAFLSGSDGAASGVEPYLWNPSLGPVRLADIVPGGRGSFPEEFTPLSATGVFFTARTSASNRELYYYEHSLPQPLNMLDLNPLTGSWPTELTLLAPGYVVFSANDGVNGREPWISDGVSTARLDINTTSGQGSSPHNFVRLGSKVLFAATDQTGDTELWYCECTNPGNCMNSTTVARVRDINPTGSSFPGEMAVLDGKVYFAATTAAHGREVWVTDGTAPNTMMVADLRPGPADSAPDQLAPNAACHSLAFTATDAGGRGLFVYRSGQPMTRANVPDAETIADLTATELPFMLGAFVFSVDPAPAPGAGRIGRELGVYVADWNAHAVVDLRSGPRGSLPTNFQPISPTEMLFRANDGVIGCELWAIRVSPSGVTIQPYHDIKPNPGRPESSWPGPLVPFGNGEYLFAAEDDTFGIELWSTSGAAGTVPMRRTDVSTGTPSVNQHLTTDGALSAFEIEITDAAPSSIGFTLLSFARFNPPVFLPGLTSGLLVVDPTSGVSLLFFTDADGNASVTIGAGPMGLATTILAQSTVLAGSTFDMSEVGVLSAGGCMLPSGADATAVGETNDDTNEYRITVCRIDSNPTTAYFGLVYRTPDNELVLLEGGDGSVSLEGDQCTELEGSFDLNSGEDSGDAGSTKVLELWMLDEPPTPDNVTSGCLVWQSYC